MRNLIVIIGMMLSVNLFSQSVITDSQEIYDTTDNDILMVIDLNNPFNNVDEIVSHNENIDGVQYFYTTFDSNTIFGTIDTVSFSKKTVGYSNTNPYPKKDEITYIIFNEKENILSIKSQNSNKFLNYKLSFEFAGGTINDFCKYYMIDEKTSVKLFYSIVDNTYNMTEIQFITQKNPTIIFSN
jgi:hypothetical protein